MRQPDDRTSSSLGPSSEVSPDDYRNFQVVSVLVARRSTFANSVLGNYLFQALFVRGCVYISFPLIMYSRVLTKPWRRDARRVVPGFYRTDTFIKYLRSYFFLSPRSGMAPFRFGAPVRATSRSPTRGSNSQTKGSKRVNGVRLLQSEL